MQNWSKSTQQYEKLFRDLVPNIQDEQSELGEQNEELLRKIRNSQKFN